MIDPTIVPDQAPVGAPPNTDPAGNPAGDPTPSLAYVSQLPGRLQTPESVAKLAGAGAKLEHLADAYLGATEKLKGFEGRVFVPGEGATAEELAAFQKAIGVPDDEKGYELKRSADLPVHEGIDEWTAKAYREAGLTKAQAEKLYALEQAKALEILQTNREQRESAAKAGIKELEKLWGRDFAQRRLELSQTVEGHFGKAQADAMFAADLGNAPGVLGNDPGFLDKMAGIAKYLKEATIRAGGGAGGGSNPWADATVNLTEQMRITRENPQFARELAKQAGKNIVI